MFRVRLRPQLRIVLGRVVVRHQLLRVALAVPVRVAGEPQSGRLGDQGTVAEKHHRPRHHQSAEEDGSTVHPTIAVRVGQDHHAPVGLGLAGPVHLPHVARHLDHPQSTLMVKLGGDWRGDQGLGGHDLRPKSLGQVQGPELVVG